MELSAETEVTVGPTRQGHVRPFPQVRPLTSPLISVRCVRSRSRSLDNNRVKNSDKDQEPLALREIKEEIEDLKDKITDLHSKTNEQITQYRNSKESQASLSLDKASQINLFELPPEVLVERPICGYSSEEETDSVTIFPSTCERDSGYSEKVQTSDGSPDRSSAHSAHSGRELKTRAFRSSVMSRSER